MDCFCYLIVVLAAVLYREVDLINVTYSAKSGAPMSSCFLKVVFAGGYRSLSAPDLCKRE